MIEKYNHKYSIAAVEQDDYLREVIEKKLPQICKGANFPDMQFDSRIFENIEDFETDEKKDIDMLLIDYPLQSVDAESNDLLDTLNDINRRKNLNSVVVISDCTDPVVIENLKEAGVKDVIQKDNNFANRIWAIVYDDVRKFSNVEDYKTNRETE